MFFFSPTFCKLEREWKWHLRIGNSLVSRKFSEFIVVIKHFSQGLFSAKKKKNSIENRNSRTTKIITNFLYDGEERNQNQEFHGITRPTINNWGHNNSTLHMINYM